MNGHHPQSSLSLQLLTIGYEMHFTLENSTLLSICRAQGAEDYSSDNYNHFLMLSSIGMRFVGKLFSSIRPDIRVS